MNYFEIFGLQQSFEIDTKQIKNTYLLLQKKYHPDKAKNDEEKISFLNLSIELNEGYKLLMNDLTRAEYILKLAGMDLNDERSTHRIDNMILSNALADRELLEELSSLDEILKFQHNKLAEENEILLKLKYEFKSQNYKQALSETIKLKYHLKLLEDIRNKINKLNAAS